MKEIFLNNEDVNNNAYMDSYNYNNTLGNIYGENYTNYIGTNNLDNVENEQIVDDINNSENPFPIDKESYLAKDSEIAKDIGLKCEDQIKRKRYL